MDRNSENAAKYKLVANSIRQYIVVNRLGSGAKLPGGRFFANKYGVSKNTIYEALGLLEDKGILDIRENSGTYVSKKTQNGLDNSYAGYIKKAWQTSNHYELLELSSKASDANSIYLGLSSLHEEFGYKQLLVDCLKKNIDNKQWITDLDRYDIKGSLSFRTLLSERLKRDNIVSSPSDIIITNGIYNSVDMLIKVLLSSGDTIYTQDSYSIQRFTQANEIGINIVKLKTDSSSICLEDFRRKTKKVKRAVLIVTSSIKVHGDCKEDEVCKKALIDFCNINNIVIIEIGNKSVPMNNGMKTFRELSDNNSIYVDSIVYPYSLGIDISWIVAPEDVMAHLALLSTRMSHYPFNLNNLVVEQMLSDGSYDEFASALPMKIEKRISEADMLLDKYLKKYATWDVKSSLTFVVIRMNSNINISKLYMKSNDYGVVFIPGEMFGDEHDDCLVITLTALSLGDLEEGIKRLKHLVEKSM